jgi:hypothetical protein
MSDFIDALLPRMTLAEKVGQQLFMSCPEVRAGLRRLDFESPVLGRDP